MTEEPTAEAILAGVSAAYRGFAEYEDTGKVTGGAASTVRFETSFRRRSVFRFSYVALLEDGKKFHCHNGSKMSLYFARLNNPPLAADPGCWTDKQ